MRKAKANKQPALSRRSLPLQPHTNENKFRIDNSIVKNGYKWIYVSYDGLLYIICTRPKNGTRAMLSRSSPSLPSNHSQPLKQHRDTAIQTKLMMEITQFSFQIRMYAGLLGAAYALYGGKVQCTLCTHILCEYVIYHLPRATQAICVVHM